MGWRRSAPLLLLGTVLLLLLSASNALPVHPRGRAAASGATPVKQASLGAHEARPGLATGAVGSGAYGKHAAGRSDEDAPLILSDLIRTGQVSGARFRAKGRGLAWNSLSNLELQHPCNTSAAVGTVEKQ
jgi:hypothetical protein